MLVPPRALIPGVPGVPGPGWPNGRAALDGENQRLLYFFERPRVAWALTKRRIKTADLHDSCHPRFAVSLRRGG